MGRNERKSAKDHSADRGDASLRRESQDRSRDRHERKRHRSPSASRRHGSTDVRHHPEQTPVNHPRRAVDSDYDDDSQSPDRSQRRKSTKRRRKHTRRDRHRRRRSSSSRPRRDRSNERDKSVTSVTDPQVSATTVPPQVSVTNDTPPVSDSSNLILAFKEIIQAMKTDGGNERYPAMNVIPEFDPSKRNQTVDIWINKVNECAAIYNWTERQIVHYALPKLVGLAQKWYQGLPSLLFSWPEWQDKLRQAFPSDENYGQLLTDMLACKARFGEPLEDYFYEKTVLLNRCKISGKQAIDCILFSIEDRSVRTSAEAAQFTEPDKLLVFLRNVKSTRRPDSKSQTNQLTPAAQASVSDKRQHRARTQNNVEHRNVSKCYNCGKEGHPYYKCDLPIKRCDKCHKVGHLASDCPNNKENANNKTVLRISQEQDNDTKYFKSALVNGKELDCFIDFGSQCTMMKESVARSLVKDWTTTDLPVLRGFGDSMVNCLGKCPVQVEVDSVQATLEAYVVPDKLLQVPILIGQTFTEQDHVIVYKNKDELKLSTNLPADETKVKLFVSEPVLVKNFTEVTVHTDTTYTGDLFVEPSLCQQPLKAYEVIQSVIKITNGSGQIVLKGLCPSGFELRQNSLLVRALPLNELKCFNVARVRNDAKAGSKYSPIDEAMINLNKDLHEDEKVELVGLLNEYRDCFAFSIEELGCLAGSEMNIKLNDTTPVVYRPYRLSYSEREVVRGMVQELEQAGIVSQSTSEYASPILLVKKKTGDHRLCVDFRCLNKRTVKEHYPLPRIDDQLDNLSGYKYYTSLDLASGYYQIPMSDASKHLTAFVTPDGHYEFNRMPFGLANAPSNFQRAINNILGNARFKDALAYMDDVIIPSKTVQEGFEKLRETMNLFRRAGLTLKLSKCHFFSTSIDYLGFEISEEGVRPGRRKIDAVEKFPQPTDQHKVRQFIGLASFFRRFIRNFSTIARPLTQLLKRDTKWHWDSLEQEAFDKLKQELTKRPVLAFYNPDFETQLHTDASKAGIAGILVQRPSKDAPFSAVAYYSRQTSPEESRFTSYDLETLAVVSSLQRFRVYLLGIPFTIVTDCNSLRATFEKKDMLPRVARWWGAMQEYDFNIVYKPGTAMAHVDALSRSPVEESSASVLEVRSVDSNWIATVQQNDSELQRIVSILNDPETNYMVDVKNNFVLKRGLLYRKTDDGDRWIVPKGVRWQVLKQITTTLVILVLIKPLIKLKATTGLLRCAVSLKNM